MTNRLHARLTTVVLAVIPLLALATPASASTVWVNPCYDTTTNGAYLLQVSSQLLPDSGVVPDSAEFSLEVNDSYSNVITTTKTSHKISASSDGTSTYYRAATTFRLRGVQFTSTYTYTINVYWYDGKTQAGSGNSQNTGAFIAQCGT